MRSPEVLAPAGSPETLTAALRSGADAVYIGGKRFSARNSADNFTDEEIARFEDDLRRIQRNLEDKLKS